jgi:hypothetical protein
MQMGWEIPAVHRPQILSPSCRFIQSIPSRTMRFVARIVIAFDIADDIHLWAVYNFVTDARRQNHPFTGATEKPGFLPCIIHIRSDLDIRRELNSMPAVN